MTTSQIIVTIAELTIVFITAFGLGYMTGVIAKRNKPDLTEREVEIAGRK